RHRVRIAPPSLPHRDGAAGGDIRHARHAAPPGAHRAPRAGSAPDGRPPGAVRRAPILRHRRMKVFGGIESGGTKSECAVGTGPDDVRSAATIPTTTPEETIGRVVDFFLREGPVDALGSGSRAPD